MKHSALEPRPDTLIGRTVLYQDAEKWAHECRVITAHGSNGLTVLSIDPITKSALMNAPKEVVLPIPYYDLTSGPDGNTVVLLGDDWGRIVIIYAAIRSR